MPNPLKGEVSIGLGKETFTLFYDVDTLCVAEDLLNLSTAEILSGVTARKVRMGFMRGLLWAGLRQHHPDLSLVEVGERFLGPGGIGVSGAQVKILDALAAAFPVAKDGGGEAAGEDPPPAADGTGSASSASGSTSG